MKIWILFLALIFFASGNAFAEQTQEQVTLPQEQVTLSLDKSVYEGGEIIKIKGKAPAGRPVYIEIASEKKVQVSRLDARRDPDTGKIPYIFYLSKDIPALYMILMPKEVEEAYKIEAAKDKDWSVSRMLTTTGADVAYITPGKAVVERWQASILATIMGSRGEKLEPLDEKGNRRQSMPLMKARFRWPERMFSPTIKINEDGTFEAEYKLPDNAPSGNYTVIAVVDKDLKSETVTFKHELSFGELYFDRAGQSLNVIGPFLLATVVTTFGVLMGAGGGFILNPLLIFIYGIPHTIVAGSVLPTVLFSQASGIYNYTRIKFISWKLGVGVGLAMLAGGFIGPKLTEMITLEQYKFLFGWVLLILGAIMLWQTTPKYIERNKKEQAILKEFKRRAEEAAAKKAEKKLQK
ncbi:MAG: TSUP family transporter [Thermodesulfovibrio sp.]|nr:MULTISPECIES: TSUP family transporter [unclassified Thermodesulfovibrio]MDI1471595.1 TSUP family transporter [Thermodesulfovibrio sp. 1176]MDI6715130.1 TSUP family transporter [Thermodesulfovibrio sp.]ODA44711.1 Arginine/ornithine antiporter ArcD [Thermodesulfovibrio sp. N1]